MGESIYIPLVNKYTDYEIIQENEYDAVEIPKALLPSSSNNGKGVFAIKIKDDSSGDALLLRGDLVAIKKITARFKNGDFLAYLQNNQIKFRYFFKQKDGYRLKPAHPGFTPEKISSLNEIRIIGQVFLVLRNNIPDLPSNDENLSNGFNNQFLVFHSTIKGLINKKRQVKILRTIMLFVIGIAVIWFFLNIFYVNWPNWTGFQKKTLWDWLDLLIIPAVISFGVFLLNQSQKLSDEIKTEEVARENAIQQYLDKMTELLLGDQRKLSNEDSKERYMARTRTLTVLRGLDGDRKGIVIKFLHEATLVQGDDEKVIVQLIASDLSYVNLSATYLGEINLNGTNLYYANFQNSNLSSSLLQNSFLYGANLSKANLTDSDLSFANLESANLTDADLTGVNLTGAKITVKQLLRD